MSLRSKIRDIAWDHAARARRDLEIEDFSVTVHIRTFVYPFGYTDVPHIYLYGAWEPIFLAFRDKEYIPFAALVGMLYHEFHHFYRLVKGLSPDESLAREYGWKRASDAVREKYKIDFTPRDAEKAFYDIEDWHIEKYDSFWILTTLITEGIKPIEYAWLSLGGDEITIFFAGSL